MSEIQLSSIFMVLGALLGSAISPASEQFFASRFARIGERYSVQNGLVLLASANGIWAISDLTYEMLLKLGSSNETVLVIYLLLLVIAFFVFIACFSQFRKSRSEQLDNTLVSILILGNMSWLCAELLEKLAGLLPDYDTILLITSLMFSLLCILVFAGGVSRYLLQKRAIKLDAN